jgi:hypothetical protein
VFAGVDTFEDAVEYYADLKARAAALGRDPDHISVLPGIAPIIADTDEEAQALAEPRPAARDRQAAGRAGPGVRLSRLQAIPARRPVPGRQQAQPQQLQGPRRAHRPGRPGREPDRAPDGRAVRALAANFVGSPQTVADEIERWFVGRAVDGFILHVTGPREFALFREKVVPILQAKGLFRTEYEHDTLRGHLGPAGARASLGRPEDRGGIPIQRALATQGARILKTALGFLSGNYIVSAHVDALADPKTSDLIGRYLRVTRQAYDWANSHQDERAAAIAKDIGVPLAYVRDQFARKSAPYGLRPVDAAAIASQQEVADVFASAGLIPRTVDVGPLWDDRFNAILEPKA